MKLWGGRFTKDNDALVEAFNASIHFDYVLAKVDIMGSLTHVVALQDIGVLNASEAEKITQGLNKLLADLKEGKLTFSVSDEDIHMNIERLLHQEIGAVAGKLHTGRSRNDQVALDLHLYLREYLLVIVAKLQHLQQALLQQAEQHIDTLLPGYTHLQRAQPIRLAHHLLTYFGMLQRDIERLIDSWPRVNTLPLGAGALAGSGFAVDRQKMAKSLGFDRVYENSMDAVSDRDFVVEFLSDAALIMTHLSRLSEEMILWSSQEFNFIEFDDAYCTGSSMMPQKKNPDIAELVRGKTGRVIGALMGLLTTLKGLPLTYNKDMQEDKEGLFDTLKTLDDSLTLYAPMIASMKVNVSAMSQAIKQDFSNATQLADYLVDKGLPFREAHAVVGKTVLHCIENKQQLLDLPLAQYQQFSELFADDLYQRIQPENVVEIYTVQGGTAKSAVLTQIQWAQAQLQHTEKWRVMKEGIIKSKQNNFQ